jgi:hypothetical protein
LAQSKSRKCTEVKISTIEASETAKQTRVVGIFNVKTSKGGKRLNFSSEIDKDGRVTHSLSKTTLSKPFIITHEPGPDDHNSGGELDPDNIFPDLSEIIGCINTNVVNELKHPEVRKKYNLNDKTFKIASDSISNLEKKLKSKRI